MTRGLLVVTSDLADFSALTDDPRSGVIVLYDDTVPAHVVTTGLLAIVEAYPSRAAVGGREVLDEWV